MPETNFCLTSLHFTFDAFTFIETIEACVAAAETKRFRYQFFVRLMVIDTHKDGWKQGRVINVK
jgi:hypothetical protein